MTMTDNLDPGLDRKSARKDINAFLAWHPVSVNARVFDGAWHLQDRYGIFWWDAVIVSGAQIADYRYLLTEDFQEERVFGDLRVVNLSPTDLESLKIYFLSPPVWHSIQTHIKA